MQPSPIVRHCLGPWLFISITSSYSPLIHLCEIDWLDPSNKFTTSFNINGIFPHIFKVEGLGFWWLSFLSLFEISTDLWFRLYQLYSIAMDHSSLYHRIHKMGPVRYCRKYSFHFFFKYSKMLTSSTEAFLIVLLFTNTINLLMLPIL